LTIALPRVHAKAATVEVIVGHQGNSVAASVTLVAVDGGSVVRDVKDAVTEKGVAETAKDAKVDSRATIVRAVVHVGTALNAVSGPVVATDLPEARVAAVGSAMKVVRVAEVGSVIAMRAEFHAPRVSATSGASALIASVMRVVHAATPNDIIPAHRRLDRGDRRCDVQWEERGTHSTR